MDASTATVGFVIRILSLLVIRVTVWYIDRGVTGIITLAIVKGRSGLSGERKPARVYAVTQQEVVICLFLPLVGTLSRATLLSSFA